VVVRKNTEGLYLGLEHYLTRKKDIAESLAVITKESSQRIVEYAFKYAKENGRKKVTASHKENILKFTSGLFLDTAKEVAKKYPEIEFDEKIIDATCMHLVMDPSQFDVIVTTNMFGDILSDLTAVIMAGVMMLNHLGEYETANKIKTAVEKVVEAGEFVTPDLNPSSKIGTIEMGEAIIAAL